MGFGGIGPGSLLIILVIVLVLFGSKKLGNMGKDLGSAIKGFKGAMGNSDGSDEASDDQGRIIEGSATETTESATTTEKDKSEV